MLHLISRLDPNMLTPNLKKTETFSRFRHARRHGVENETARHERHRLDQPHLGKPTPDLIVPTDLFPVAGDGNTLERVGVEGVALTEVAGFEAFAEPADPLFRGTVGEGVGDDVASGTALEGVVANCGSRL